MTHTLRVPYVMEQDEDGAWCARSILRPGVGAFGDGETPEEAMADLREGLLALFESVDPLKELPDVGDAPEGPSLEITI